MIYSPVQLIGPIEKKHAQFDEKYDLSQKLLAKRNDQLKDLEAALLAAREQKKTLQAQTSSLTALSLRTTPLITILKTEIQSSPRSRTGLHVHACPSPWMSRHRTPSKPKRNK